MNLFELKEKQEETRADISYYKKEIERLEAQVGVGATDYSKELVDSSISINATEEALLELTQMTMYLDDAIKKLDNITSLVNNMFIKNIMIMTNKFTSRRNYLNGGMLRYHLNTTE